MNKLFAVLSLSLLLAAPAFAQVAAPASVAFTTSATMPSLKDNSKKDTFVVTVKDSQVAIKFEETCTAGRTELFIMRSDKACSVKGAGSITNPGNGAQLPRTQYAGGYIVTADGSTDATDLSVNFLALGKVPPAATTFTGSLTLKPEVTSSGASALRDAVLKNINTNAGGALIDQRVDTVDINRFFIPSGGLPSDVGTTWNGNMVFSYQTQSWFLNLTANFNGKEYPLKGNMPLTETAGVENQNQYDLTLTLPAAELAGDDALFASSTGNDDLFATVDGISGQLIMKNSNFVTIDIDGTPTETPAQVDAAGTFTGTNIPVEVVRSLSVLFGLLPSTLFGA